MVAAADVRSLFRAVPPDDLDESGVAELTDPVVVARAADGEIAAACG